MTYQPVSQHCRATDFGRVAVLMGDTSSEREVSLQSGQAVTAALQSVGVNAVAIDLQENYLKQLTELDVDCAFIAMHGGLGEGGHIQAILDALAIPYAGSGVAASALAMNKLLSKRVFIGDNIPTPNFVIVEALEDWQSIQAKLGTPFIIKPACEGSTIGISHVTDYTDWCAAFQLAQSCQGPIIAEQLINGPEYTVAILNGQALPSINIVVPDGMYDYEAKYLSNKTQFICPCDLNDIDEQAIRSLSLRAFDSLGCSDWGRVDLMRDQAGQFQVLEVNTIPGLTSHSLVPMAAKAAGLSFSDLIVEILAVTVTSERHKIQKQASVC